MSQLWYGFLLRGEVFTTLIQYGAEQPPGGRYQEFIGRQRNIALATRVAFLDALRRSIPAGTSTA